MLRVLEEGPEVVADHVGGDLPAADRPADEGADEVFGVVQHELVARPRRDRGEGLERVGTMLQAVARHPVGVPVAAEEQLPGAFELRLAERIGDVGLVHDHALDRPQAVIEGAARVVVGPARGDGIDRLAAGRARAHQLEEVPRLSPFGEVQVRQEQVLVQPARHQPLAGARPVEEGFPLGDLQRLRHTRLQRLLVHRRALRQPLSEGRVFLLGEAADGERHADPRVLPDELVDAVRRRALVAAADRQVEPLGNLRVGLQRMRAAQVDHPRHQRRLPVAAVQHRPEFLAPPGIGAVGVEEQPGGFLRLRPCAVIHRQAVGATPGAFGGAQVELAGRVVAGVAGHALGGEDRLHILAVGDFAGRGRCGEQHEKGRHRGSGAQQHENLQPA
ncbi:hypothetical protein D9M71_345230 [compost metagenome]